MPAMSRGVSPWNRYGMAQGQPQGGSGVEKAYGLYDKAAEEQTGNYSNIMDAYRNIIAGGPSSEYRAAHSNLSNLAQSGGYSEGDINNLRERALSPIRSIYASANRDIERNRTLKGGYSPGYAAVKAKMARELSTSLGNQMTNVNAGLAERIAQNKIGLAPQLANTAQEFDANKFRALQGATSLYGTTPAMAATFGNQALQGAQLQNTINQQNTDNEQRRNQQMMNAWSRY